jgi:hypothetical protein
MASWVIITAISIGLAQKFRSERTTLIAGCLFLCLGVVVPLLLTALFSTHLSCNNAGCDGAKIQAQTIIGFFTVSWAAFGANLLSALISHK